MTIDVMLPYYGDIDLMKAAVRSVLAQSERGWRLVVIDDGYPDPEPRRWFTEDIDDPRVVYLRNEQNLGANGNYRKALALVESDWFVMMGADDIMQSNYLSVIRRDIETHPDADVIQPGARTIDEHGIASDPLPDVVKRLYAPRVKTATGLTGEQLAISLLRADWAYFPSLAWKTSTVQRIGFRTGYNVVQDLALLLDIAAEGGTLIFEPEFCFSYRRHSGSDSSVKAMNGERFNEERRFFAWQARRFHAMGWDRAARTARLHLSSRCNALTVAGRALLQGHFEFLRPLARHVVR
jgi:glycosyltransferase involved in cell wall biosynthesis